MLPAYLECMRGEIAGRSTDYGTTYRYVLFAPLSQPKAIETMKTHAEQAYTMGMNKINTDMYLFTRDGKELLTYDETKY